MYGHGFRRLAADVSQLSLNCSSNQTGHRHTTDTGFSITCVQSVCGGVELSHEVGPLSRTTAPTYFEARTWLTRVSCVVRWRRI